VGLIDARKSSTAATASSGEMPNGGSSRALRIRGQLRLRAEWRLDGESRQIWEHSIPLVEQRRYSVTFRPMKGDIIGR
jgi:hypothetical protein